MITTNNIKLTQPQTWTTAQTFSAAVTLNAAATINGGATFTSLTTHSGKFVLSNADVPATFTAAGVAGQIVLRPSNGALYICMSTNSWYQIALSNTTAFN